MGDGEAAALVDRQAIRANSTGQLKEEPGAEDLAFAGHRHAPDGVAAGDVDEHRPLVEAERQPIGARYSVEHEVEPSVRAEVGTDGPTDRAGRCGPDR